MKIFSPDDKEIKQGEKVVAKIHSIEFKGIIVGIASQGYPIFGRTYIVKCTDNTFPNETYKYDTLAIQEVYLEVK